MRIRKGTLVIILPTKGADNQSIWIGRVTECGVPCRGRYVIEPIMQISDWPNKEPQSRKVDGCWPKIGAETGDLIPITRNEYEAIKRRINNVMKKILRNIQRGGKR